MSNQRSPYSNVNFDNLLKINSFRMNVQDYTMLSPSLAKVILSYTGVAPSKDEIRATIANNFKGLAAAVNSSFRVLDTSGATKTIVGFVKANHEVRDLADMDPSRTKALASNLLMDTVDSSTWEIKAGASGQYVVKQGDEDLSALVHLAHTRQVGLPTLAQVASPTAEPREFAAYVDKDTDEVQHGFVVASENGQLTVVSFDTNEPVQVEEARVVEVRYLEETETAQLSASPMVAEVASDKAAMVEYYKKAYPYAPEYVQQIIDMINQHSFA